MWYFFYHCKIVLLYKDAIIYLFSSTATTSYHKLGGLGLQCIVHSSGGQKSEIKVAERALSPLKPVGESLLASF